LPRLYEQILKDPRNVDHNLRYARLAEQRGDLRKALTGYERVTVDDPTNDEAAKGYLRMRRKLEPDTTKVTVELGVGYDSNPARLSSDGTPAAVMTHLFDLRDDRAVGDFNWRTTALLSTELYAGQGELNYLSAGFLTGPVFDLSSKTTANFALGATTSRFEDSLYYNEGTAAANFDTAFWNATESLRLRAGVRQYGDFFDSSAGYYLDATARVVWSDAFVSGDVLIVAPRYRFSDITGLNLQFSIDPVQPGHYQEMAIRAEYYRPIVSWLTLGGSFTLGGRVYTDEIDPVTSILVKRQDMTVTPGLSAIFPDLFRKSSDLRFDYRYELNQSTVDIRNYIDHIVTTTAVIRF
jgi:hypothetical protein